MKIRTIITMIATLALTSCANEELTEENISPGIVSEKMTRVELFTDADDFSRPASRTGKADETTVGSTPWVFVFKSSDLGGAYVEAAQSEVKDSKTYVTLKKTSEKRKLLILANPPATFYKSPAEPNATFNETNVKEWLTGKTCDDAIKMLTTALDATNQATVPYTSSALPYPSLPMSGVCDLDNIEPSTTVGTSANKVPLYRIVAKVTVTNAAPGFTLEGATVVGASRQGYLFPVTPVATITEGVTPTTTDYLTTTGDGVTGIAGVTGDAGAETTTESPIYIYESAAGQASLIIKGAYKGVSYYYKIAFKNPKDAVSMAVERNCWYKFTIIFVGKAGYATAAEAIAGEPFENITALMQVTDISSFEIIDNGQYYLGVSNSEFIACTDKEITFDNNIIAVTIRTNATSAMVGSEYAITTLVPGAGDITVEPTNVTLSTGGTNIGETIVKIAMPTTFTTASTGEITIKLGNLTKKIKVARRLSLEFGRSVTEFSNNYTAGIITNTGNNTGWISLSLDGTRSLGTEVKRPDAAGKIYLMATKNTGLTERKGGEVFLSRQNESGRVKLYLTEAEVGENCYIVAPNKTGLEIPVARANASDLGVQLSADEQFTGELVWTDSPQSTSSPYNGVHANAAISKISVSGVGCRGYLVIDTGTKSGNAVVAIKNSSDEILWSWHIWVVNYDPEDGKYISNDKTFMERNLGALNNTKGDIGSKGLLYQWGRKDPFAGSNSVNGNVAATVYKTSSSFSFSPIFTPGDVSAPHYNLVNAIANPATIYRGVSHGAGVNDYDWYSDSSYHDDFLWDYNSAKTVYDPCPKGWRVPTSGVGALSPWYGLSAQLFSAGQGADWTTRGYYPAAGKIEGESGSIKDVGEHGYYMTASITDYWTYYLHFTATTTPPVTATINANFNAVRSSCGSVRCVKIQ